MRTKKTISVLVLFLSLIFVLSSARAVCAAQEDLPWYYGTAEYYSTYQPGSILSDRYYYSDNWFYEDPAAANDFLALLSMQLTAASVDRDANGLGGTFLQKLGFDDIGFCEDVQNCNYTYGTKTIGRGDDAFTLVAVVLQSYGFDEEVKRAGWEQNFRINCGDNGEILSAEHDSYAAAADSGIESIRELGGSGNRKYWIMGHSRGGALAGMLAARLYSEAESVYAYTFEAPACVEQYSESDYTAEYPFIHNYLSTDDLVTMIPPWGMVRYGVDYPIDTPEANAELTEQLTMLGSAAAEDAQYFDSDQIRTLAGELLSALEGQIPTREIYSQIQQDVFTDAEGQEVTISYTYQDLFIKIVNIALNGRPEGFSTDTVLEKASSLSKPVLNLIKAVQEEDLTKSQSCYYEAAKGLNEFLAELGVDLPLTDEDLYVLLKLGGGTIVDPTFVPESEELDLGEIINALFPAVNMFDNATSMLLPHHFETTIARLKTLAGEKEVPERESFDIIIDEPNAGDPVDASAAGAAFDALEYDWLIADVQWDTTDEAFKDNYVYYLKAALTAEGKVADGFKVTLNGTDPAEQTITYQNGISVINERWAFTIGTPDKVTVSFDTSGLGEPKDPLQVDAGTRLGTLPAEQRAAFDLFSVKDPDGNWGYWQCIGWTDDNGTSWDEVAAANDLTLHASWIRVIDNIELTFHVPQVGDPISDPLAEKNAPYQIMSVEICNEGYEYVDRAAVKKAEALYMSFDLIPESETAEFLPGTDEYGEPAYAGKLTINGTEAEIYYDPTCGSIRVAHFPFTPKAVRSTSITSLTNAKKVMQGFTAKWKSAPGVSGYQVQYSTKSDFSSKKTMDTTKTSLTVSGLKKGKTYYVRVRSYRTVNGKKYCSNWCSKKKIKIKSSVKATSISSLKNTKKAKKGFTVKWKKVSGVSGYRVQYSTKKDFSSKKSKDTTKTSLTVSGLKKGKTYYVRVLAYKTVDGRKYYSNWCAKKKIRIK